MAGGSFRRHRPGQQCPSCGETLDHRRHICGNWPLAILLVGLTWLVPMLLIKVLGFWPGLLLGVPLGFALVFWILYLLWPRLVIKAAEDGP